MRHFDSPRSLPPATGTRSRLCRLALVLSGFVVGPSACERAPAVLAGPGVDAPAPVAPVCDAPLPPATSAAGTSCALPLPASPDLLDEALAATGLDRCALDLSGAAAAILPPEASFDPLRLSWAAESAEHPLLLPSAARETVRRLDDAAASERPVARALQVAAERLGASFAVCAREIPAPSSSPLVDALVAVAAARGGRLAEAALVEDAADVPVELQAALAPILLAAGAAAAVYERAVAGLSRRELERLRDAAWLALPGHAPELDEEPLQSWVLGEGFPAAEVYAAAARLAATIEDAHLERFAGTTGFAFDADSGIGRVVIRDAAAQVHDPSERSLGVPVLLLLDTGGDDTYLVPAGAPADIGSFVSVALDLAGDDVYAYAARPDPRDGTRLPSDEAGRWAGGGDGDGAVSLSETPRQGAGRLGIGMLFDFGGGRDEYRSLRMSQGFALFGVGVLRDDGGDDTYAGEAGVQGAAAFGIGLLLDGGGNDSYRAYNSAQGFGFSGGAGVLYDLAGDDGYFADPGDPAQGGDPLYLADQLPGAGNRSMAQGMGFGRRADTTDDGVYLSGGVGILRDAQGDDDYVCSVWCQGSGYWFGTGILDDADGDDDYDALYYGQGAAAHFGLASFRDGNGDDRYQQRLRPVATSIGVGHDFGVAFHVDGGGNDLYRAPPLSLGAGSDNGVGVLVNVGGADVYEVAAEPALGAASAGESESSAAARRSRLTVGVFVDAGESDAYVVGASALPRDGTVWGSVGSALPTHGVGLDRTAGRADL